MSGSLEKQTKGKQNQSSRGLDDLTKCKSLHAKSRSSFFMPHEKMKVKTPKDYRTEAEKRHPQSGLW